MKGIKFFVSGTSADCLDYFKEDQVLLRSNNVVDLLTKGAAYKLYLSETFEEAKRLGECIYQFMIPAEVLEDNEKLYKYAERQCALDVPVYRIQ